MIRKHQNKNEQLDDLIKITNTIYSIYLKLINSRTQNDWKQYQENLEDFKLCLEVEDKLYQEINPSLKNNLQNYLELSRLLERKANSHKECILSRIEIHLLTYYFANPFLSMQQDQEFNLNENTIAILNQYNIDFIQLKSYFIESLVSELKNETLKEQFLSIKYDDIFRYKMIERNLLKEQKVEKPKLDGKERCLLFGQEESFVNESYFTKSNLVFWNQINAYLIKEIYEDYVKRNTILFSIYTALCLLNPDQLEKIYYQFCREYYIQDLKSFDKRVEEIVTIFNQLREEKKVKTKIKSL